MAVSDDSGGVEVAGRAFDRRNHSSGMQKRKPRRAEEQNGLDAKGLSMMFEIRVEAGSLESSNNDSAHKFGSPFEEKIENLPHPPQPRPLQGHIQSCCPCHLREQENPSINQVRP